MPFNHVVKTSLGKTLTSSAVLSAALLAVSQAEAAPYTINFGQNAVTQQGSVFYDGNGGALMGSGLRFDTIFSDSPGADSPLTCVGCTLNFQTGAFIGEEDDEDEDTLTSFSFGAGGSFSLVGGVLDDEDNVVFSGTILDGSFTGVSLAANPGELLINAFGTDSKAPAVLDALALDTKYADSFGFSLSLLGETGIDGTGGNVGSDNPIPGCELSREEDLTDGDIDCSGDDLNHDDDDDDDDDNGNGAVAGLGSFSVDIGSAEITNDAVAVPVPGSLALLGLSLLGIPVLRRRR